MSYSCVQRTKYLIDGIWYQWHGWLGCQLQSEEIFKPKSYNRNILDYEFEVFNIERDYWYYFILIPKPWYRITWRLKDLRCCSNLDEENTLIRRFQKELKK